MGWDGWMGIGAINWQVALSVTAFRSPYGPSALVSDVMGGDDEMTSGILLVGVQVPSILRSAWEGPAYQQFALLSCS